jgi:hypothetical protein
MNQILRMTKVLSNLQYYLFIIVLICKSFIFILLVKASQAKDINILSGVENDIKSIKNRVFNTTQTNEFLLFTL